jgi:Rps23 Pro-64 3,4-dihydroxylase Tpa1-like proline 4-hydroxylase
MIKFELSDHLSGSYSKAYPFPHVIIDNFISNPDELDRSITEISNFPFWGWDSSKYSLMDNRQINKFWVPWCEQSFNDLKDQAPTTLKILNYFNSPEILEFLQNLTGIENLIPDPTFTGGGVHKITSGGKLGIHADYLLHPETKLHRRLNVLVYLNKNWQKEWGGDLELWNKDMTECIVSIEPIFNRAVIFNITSDSFHGHPNSLDTPEGVDRYSYAFYYFTEDRPDHEKNNLETHAVWKKPIEKINSNIIKV